MFYSLRLALMAAAILLSGGFVLAGQVMVDLPPLNYEIEAAFSSEAPGTEFSRITAPGYGSVGSPGDPDLPCTQIHVAIPPGADLSTLTVSLTGAQTQSVTLDHHIVPCPPIRPNDNPQAKIWGSGKSMSSGMNSLVYASDSAYPASHLEIIHVGQMRRWKLVTVRYFPFVYHPESRTLSLVRAGRIVIGFEGGAVRSTSDAAAAKLAPTVRALVANYDEAVGWYAPTRALDEPAPSATGEYVIVTRSYVVNNSTKLAQFVTRLQERGFSVQIATEAQWGGGVGLAATNNIRQWLKNNYLALGTRYVLLVGNPTPECYISSAACAVCCQSAPPPGDIPMLGVWPHWNEYSDPNAHGGSAPTDLYYSDLTGNWDLDGDGVYGDYKKSGVLHDFGPGGVDFFPEVYVGRIPMYGDPNDPVQLASSIADLDSILEKFISYSPPWSGDWSRRALLPANTLDPNHPEVSHAEAIKQDILTPAGIDCTRIYDVNGGTEPEILPCTYDNVRNAWLQGYGFVFWSAHGNPTDADDVLNSGGCVNLDNTKPSFVFQNSCSTGRPESPDNLGYSLLKNGAIATVAASRVSWYGTLDYAFGQEDEGLVYRYCTRLVRWGRSCGDALAFTKADSLPTHEYGWDNYAMYNLYGEPSLSGIATIDDCAGAEAIISMPFNTTVYDVGLATTDQNDPELTCGAPGAKKGSHSVWYKIVPQESTFYTANTMGSDYDTVLGVLSGSCGAFSEIACSDDYSGRQSLVNWYGYAGVSYYIVVTSYGVAQAGTLSLEVRKSNDECVYAEAITTLPYTTKEYTSACGTSGNDPFLTCGESGNQQGSRSVWYVLTAPFSGPFQANTLGSDYDTVLAVHTGYCGSMTEVVCNNNYSSSQQSFVQWQAEAGVAYYIEVTSYGSSLGGTLHLEVKCNPPVNDDQASPWVIYAMPYNAQQDTRCATSVHSDPWLTCSGRGSHSVWYKLDGFGAVPYEVSTTGSNFNTVIGVFKSVGGQLTQVACNDNDGSSMQSVASWQAEEGVDFHLIEVTSYGETDGGMLNLHISSAVPANDECHSATVVEALPYTAAQNTTYATIGEFDPSLSCGDQFNPRGGHSVWYKFVPTQAGQVVVDTVGSDYDTVLAVHTGFCNAYTELVCNDDTDGRQSQVVFNAEAQTMYYIEVVSYGTGPAGQLQLKIRYLPPANDDCPHATQITALSGHLQQFTDFATVEPYEPVPGCAAIHNTVWHEFTPTSSGVALLSTEGSGFDTVLAVYTGSCRRSGFTQVACNDDAVGASAGSRWSAVALDVEAGVTYLVQAGSYHENVTGFLNLAYEIGPPGLPLAQARCSPVGARVTIEDAVVNAIFLGFPNVQQLDRSAGIHLTMGGSPPAVGTVVTAIGVLTRSDEGNLYVYGGIAVGTGSASVKPLGMSTKAAGGGAICEQLGSAGGQGVNNIGLLVKIWGRVTGVDPAYGYYWVDDGAGLTGAPPYTGIRVWTMRQTLPSVNDLVTVAGTPWVWDPNQSVLICEPAWETTSQMVVDKSVTIIEPTPAESAVDPAVRRQPPDRVKSP